MKKSILLKTLCPILVGFFIYLLPVPHGMNPKGWYLFAIFMACIAGIICKPFPMGVVTLASAGVAVITGVLDLEKEALSSYSSSIIWLIVYVFFIARGFIKSHLGTRIACFFIKLLGKRSLGLGYGIVFTDLLISPLIPSSAARAGGVLFPIVKAMAESFGSHPLNKSSRKLGAFLIQVCFHCNLVTSAMFLTAMAANPMVQEIAFKTEQVSITWTNWFVGAIIPGILSLIIVPLVLYIAYPPEMKKIPKSVDIATKKLKDLGNVKPAEWTMIATVSLMLFFWITGESFNISPTTTALLGLSILLMTNVITIDDILEERDAWHTLIWYSIVVSMATCLQKFGFVTWFSGHMQVFFSGFDWHYAFIGLVLVYFYSHYFLASNAAHIGAMYGAFLMVSVSIGAPPLLAALVLGYSSSLFSHMAQYGSSTGVILFGAGYVPIGTWFFLGFLISVVNVLIWGVGGAIWWKYLGWW